MLVQASGGYQSSSLSFADTRRESYFGEQASWTADYAVKSGPVFEAGGGVRIWRNLVASASYSRFTDTQAAAIIGRVPHPFFFASDRAISGESPVLKQQEQAIHASALWVFALRPSLQVSLFGGPSFFTVDRDLVEDVSYSDAYPYDAAIFEEAVVRQTRDDAVGLHAGADVSWLFTPALGVGLSVRFSRAQVALDSPAGSGALDLDVGGLQLGAGVRLRFGGKGTSKRKEPVAPPEPAVRKDQSPKTPPKPETSAPPPPRVPPSKAVVRSVAPPPAATEGRRSSTGVVMRIDAPVYIAPDTRRTPLTTLRRGTRLRLVEEAGDWLVVEFDDRQYGLRTGYVRREVTDW